MSVEFTKAVLRPFTKIPGITYALVALIAGFAWFIPGFFTPSNLLSVVRQGSVLAIVALGATLAILTRGVNLSLGGVMSLAGVVAGVLMHQGLAVTLATLGGILTGVGAGWLTGLIIARAGIAPFIVTLGMMSVGEGLALVLSGGASVPGLAGAYQVLGQGYLLRVPWPFWIAVGLFLLVHFLLKQTQFGTAIYAIGGNEEAAGLSGIDVRRGKFQVYLLGGFLAGIAGVVLASRMNSAHPSGGIGFEFDAIAATVVGGTPMSGGRGGVAGTMYGATIISVMRNGLNMLGLPTPWQMVVVGSIIVGSVTLDALRSRR
jgi:ribose/xylose/arabinose/galactoside ABC-type transport system permease subunit